ncbi:hypothetical protein ACFXAF_36025 [Kitasatospora sp. NPDC059463]|uniref:hypothetical protein n=1 Tax=unclassified Kitasatospora TaxID=2633591 RepID=UPI0036BE7CDD
MGSKVAGLAPPDPVTDVGEWTCGCGRFGILLPLDYLKKNPEELPVQACGRRRAA